MSLGMIMPLWSTGKSASPDCKSQRKGTHWGLTVTPESTGREGRALDQRAGSLAPLQHTANLLQDSERRCPPLTQQGRKTWNPCQRP